MRDLSLTSFPCQKHIRKAALLFMDREDNQSRFNLPSAAAVIKYCKTEKKSDGPSLSADNSPSNPLLLGLNATASSPWNVRCFRIFAKAYVKLSDSLCDDVVDCAWGSMDGYERQQDRRTWRWHCEKGKYFLLDRSKCQRK